MSLRLDIDVIVLEGRCAAEDAEQLLLALQDVPGATVDLAGVRKLHMAVVQVLLALRPPVRGTPEVSDFTREMVLPLISGGDRRANSS